MASKPDAFYQILWKGDVDGGHVVLVIAESEDAKEVTQFSMPRDVAKRMGKRLIVASERAARANRN